MIGALQCFKMKIIVYANQIGYNSAIHGKYNSFHVFLIKLIYEKKKTTSFILQKESSKFQFNINI